GDLLGDAPVVLDLGVVAHAPEQAVGDARGAARAPRYLARAAVVNVGVEDVGGAADDGRQLFVRVEVEVEGDAEAPAQGRGDGAGGRAHFRVHLVGDDVGERRLAEAGRAGQQDVVERLATPARGPYEDAQVPGRLLLADVLGEPRRPQGKLDQLLVVERV